MSFIVAINNKKSDITIIGDNMRKYFILLILLIIPFGVGAKSVKFDIDSESTYHFPFIQSSVVSGLYRYYYSSSFSYENGVYTLINPTYESLPGSLYSYTCLTEYNEGVSCEELYAVYRGYLSYMNFYPAYKLVGGEDENKYLTFKVSKNYHKNGDKYVLDNPTDFYTYNTVNKFGDTGLKDYYFCENRSDTCDELFHILFFDGSGPRINISSKDYVCSRGFVYKNGKYYLKDIVPSQWPNYDRYVGLYSCMNNENSCDKLYRINNYTATVNYKGSGQIDLTIIDYYDLTTIDSSNKNITINTKSTYNINNYLKDSSYVWIEDNSILKIENKEIIPLKVGSTNVLIQNDEDVLLLNVNINELNNPKTGVNYIAFGLLIIISFGIILFYKKYNIFR